MELPSVHGQAAGVPHRSNLREWFHPHTLKLAIFAALAEKVHSPQARMNMQADIIEEYVRRRKGESPLMPDHPTLVT